MFLCVSVGMNGVYNMLKLIFIGGIVVFVVIVGLYVLVGGGNLFLILFICMM